MLLGAIDLTPVEVAQEYQTIASGGNRAPLSAVRSVIAEDGTVLYQELTAGGTHGTCSGGLFDTLCDATRVAVDISFAVGDVSHWRPKPVPPTTCVIAGLPVLMAGSGDCLGWA